jgi:cytochrome c2
LFFSCGPRSGIHQDEKQEEVKDIRKETPVCGNAGASSKGQKLFKLNCATCHMAHTDQILTGPGLKGVTDRIPKPAEEWFIKYTLNCEKVYKSGDPYAKKLHDEYRGMTMTIFEGHLSEEDAREIYSYLTGRPVN